MQTRFNRLLDKGMAAVFVSQTNPVWIELYSYAHIFFCFDRKACSLIMSEKLYRTRTKLMTTMCGTRQYCMLSYVFCQASCKCRSIEVFCSPPFPFTKSKLHKNNMKTRLLISRTSMLYLLKTAGQKASLHRTKSSSKLNQNKNLIAT